MGLMPTEKPPNKRSLMSLQAIRFGFYLPGIKADDWNTLFLFLRNILKKANWVIVLDEISWIGSEDPDFLGKLKNAGFIFKKKIPLILIVVAPPLAGSIKIFFQALVLW